MATRKRQAPPPSQPEQSATSSNEESTAIWVDIEHPKPDPHNVREHNPRNLQLIKSSLQRFGQRKPLVMDADGFVCAGNGTLQAARELGWSRIWVAPTHLRGAEARAFAIADNRAGDLSQFDEIELIGAVRELPDELVEFTGFDQAELADLLPTAEDAAPPAGPAAGSSTSRTSSHKHGLDARKSGRVVARVMVETATIALFERALQATGLKNREEALNKVCHGYLQAAGQLDL